MNNEQFKKLKSEIITNKGATLNANGEKMALSRGYVVSVEKYGFTLSASDFNGFTLKQFKRLLNVAKVNGLLLGFWLDSDLIYIDFNKVIQDKKSAVSFGKKQHQKAIFNLKTCECIAL